MLECEGPEGGPVYEERKADSVSDTATTKTIPFEFFREALLSALDETFENVKGMYLDPGDSLYPTLDGISAVQASQPVGTGCSSIAAQVNHLSFYIDLGCRYMSGENPGKQNWDATWAITEVNDDEWTAMKQQLRDRHQHLLTLIHEDPQEPDDDFVGGAFGMVAHTAYHLGQIRHSLCGFR